MPVSRPVRLTPFLKSPRFLNVLPLSVRSVVMGLMLPEFVLTIGSTTATFLPCRSITLLLTMTGLVLTTTTLVKLWQTKYPGNQNPNQKTG